MSFYNFLDGTTVISTLTSNPFVIVGGALIVVGLYTNSTFSTWTKQNAVPIAAGLSTMLVYRGIRGASPMGAVVGGVLSFLAIKYIPDNLP